MSLQPISNALQPYVDAQWREIDDEPEYDCDTCHDGRFLRLPQTRDELIRNGTKLVPCPDCAGGESEPVERSDERMRVPVAYRDADIARLDSEQRLAIADIISTHPKTPLVTMIGNVGAGKTYAAVVALRMCLSTTGGRGAFWPVIDLLERYRATFDADRATETSTAIDAEMRRCPLLVFDDWGKHKSTEWAEQQLFRVVDERYRDRRPLIVTTNASPDDFSEALRSRLFGSSAKVVAFSGRDKRLS